MKKILTLGHKIVTYGCFIVLICVGLIAVSTRFSLPGGYRMYSVLTGSMSPAIQAGSLIIGKAPHDINYIHSQDVITFSEPGYETRLITHRVVTIEESEGTTFFITKGDANQSVDPWKVPYGRIKSKSYFSIPYIGSLIEFLRTPAGIIIFVIIPVAVLVYTEFRGLLDVLVALRIEKKSDIKNVILIFLLFSILVPSTQALFISSPVSLNGITLTTAAAPSPSLVIFAEADGGLVQQHAQTNYGKDDENEIISKTGKNKRLIIRFNIASLPADRTVASCRLKLFMEDAPDDSREYGIYPVTLVPWTEGLGTTDAAKIGESSWLWYQRPNKWLAAGGDMGSVADAITFTGTEEKSWVSWDVTSACQNRLEKNWIIRDQAENSSERFDSEFRMREYKGDQFDPRVEVVFAP